VGLIGVQRTMESDFYKSKLQSHGIDVVVPGKASREYIHDKIISELVLNQFTSKTKQGFLTVIEEMASMNVKGVILGCTEIPLLLNTVEVQGITLFSTTDIHCKAIIDSAFATNT